jgi:hypothetical protein
MTANSASNREQLKTIDAQLLEAIDKYVSGLRDKMIERALKCEPEYVGKWKTLSVSDLFVMEEEEVVDMHNYRAMTEARIRRL